MVRLSDLQVAKPSFGRFDRRRGRGPILGLSLHTQLMTTQLHDEVILSRDVLEHGLRAGDIGMVVHVYPKGGLEVEFFTAAGKTRAVVTLREGDVRTATDNDVVAVRSLGATGCADLKLGARELPCVRRIQSSSNFTPSGKRSPRQATTTWPRSSGCDGSPADQRTRDRPERTWCGASFSDRDSDGFCVDVHPDKSCNLAMAGSFRV
jgi:hypothetical protein